MIPSPIGAHVAAGGHMQLTPARNLAQSKAAHAGQPQPLRVPLLVNPLAIPTPSGVVSASKPDPGISVREAVACATRPAQHRGVHPSGVRPRGSLPVRLELRDGRTGRRGRIGAGRAVSAVS
jgi:hypothetical protein